MHGAGGGSKPGRAHPNLKHVGRTREANHLRKLVNTLGSESRELADAMNPPDSQGITAIGVDN